MRPHSTDLLSLIFGAVFLAIAGLWLATRFVPLAWPMLGWLVVAGLGIVGGIGVGLALRHSRREPHPDDSRSPE